MSFLGKWLILFGFILILLGLIFVFMDKIPFLGKLPGDIRIERKNFIFYFPLTTSILLSLILTIIINIILRLRK
ncbi:MULTISPECIES: DUF2905 domain-containing protein [Dictyoglomus]|uniref:DUF2905 domain-containing protein n=1 Tax=Dictyoglomus turgidum (strain DSM 6724 / Z-1310) TaxID=515635 RepID=B8E2N8_DICTD|nr:MULTISPECIES: DUF2905 domain-containing protein [Dictyoglomus]ACK42882.1 conserved hypothetical protein [Dictyoglomus turgidum DSM 6724]HBU30944.1 DUF2905 domain-containing protein [Dictyoglomus sp.]